MYLGLPVTMSWHWTPPTRIPMIRNVHWIRDRYCMLGIRTSGRLVSYVYHLLPSFERHRLKKNKTDSNSNSNKIIDLM